MLVKKLSFLVLLVLLLSMGSAVGQYSHGNIAVVVSPTESGLKISSMQVGTACVPGYASHYQVWKYNQSRQSLVPVSDTPSLNIGGMEGWIGGSFYFYPVFRWLTQAGTGGLWANGEMSGIFLLSPYGITREMETTCNTSPMVYHGEIPLFIMGGLTEYPAVFRKQGAAVKEVNYDFLESKVVVSVVAFHPTRAVVYEKMENQRGQEATRQRVFALAGTGTAENFELPLSIFGPEVRNKNKSLYIHLLDEITLVSTNETLVDWGRKVYDENGKYIRSEYYKLFVGNDE